jgi:hypothetical protein
MCPGCKMTIPAGEPYCQGCFLTPVPRPGETAPVDAAPQSAAPQSAAPPAAAPANAAAGPAACDDPDCVHGGQRPAAGCQHCGLRGAGDKPATLVFPWGPVVVPSDRPLLVGREDSPMAGQLAQYANVSRRHAEIRSDGRSLTVVDLDSVNGTFINDERIAPRTPTPARIGDRLRFAASLVVHVQAGGDG